jgi:hypothetical protein
MGLLDLFRRGKSGIRVRCAMCKVHATFDESKRGQFVYHTCDADLLVGEPDAVAMKQALDLFVFAYEHGPPTAAERIAARDRLLYGIGEGAIPGLEDLLYRIKYELSEQWPFPEIASRVKETSKSPVRIDWANELEMYLHRMKKYAITQRQIAAVAPSARGILEQKLERLKSDPLVPLEED